MDAVKVKQLYGLIKSFQKHGVLVIPTVDSMNNVNWYCNIVCSNGNVYERDVQAGRRHGLGSKYFPDSYCTSKKNYMANSVRICFI